MNAANISNAQRCVRVLQNRTDFLTRSLCSSNVLCCPTPTVHQSTPVSVSTPPNKSKIVIPLRKKRDELSVLQALASTVHKDFSSPSFKFIDDPYLIPLNNLNKRKFALARASGQKTAQFVISKYPQNFAHDPADPPIQEFKPPEQLVSSDDSLDGLLERINERRPLAAYESYQKLLAAGVSVPVETVEDLLDLLCVYNSADLPEDLSPDEQFYLRDSGLDNSIKVRKDWRTDGAAELVFKSLNEPSVGACCSLIRGRAKYFDAEKAYELFQELRKRDVKLDVKTYNAILNVAFLLGDRADSRWELIQEILSQMAASDVAPTVDTFNAALFSLTRSSRFPNSTSWCSQVINEMHRCHIEPTLTTWFYATQIEYSNDECQSRLLNNIVDHLAGQELTANCPTDYEFFSTAMIKNHINLKDLELAYKLETLLNVGDNRSLIGDSYREALYYTHFLRLLCTFEQIDTIMTYYNKFTPHVYTPTFAVLRDVLTAIELNEGYTYLPRIWSDLVTFQYVRRVDLVEHLLSVMAKHKQDEQLQELFVKVVDSILVQYEADSQNRRINNPLILTGRMIGDMIQIHLYSGNTAQAWDVLQLYVRNRLQITSFPSESSLYNMSQVCIKENNVEKTLQTLSLMSDFGYTKLDELVQQVKSSMQLTDHQRSHLDDLL